MSALCRCPPDVRFDTATGVTYIARMMLLRERSRGLSGQIEPSLPRAAKEPPAGPGWIHEIKHDGFRILARKEGASVRLITRNGNDFTGRFPFIAMAVATLPARSCIIDGEAIVCDDNGLAVFDLIRGHGAKATAVHCASFSSRTNRTPRLGVVGIWE